MQNNPCIQIKQKQFGAGTPLVCVPLVGNNEASLYKQADAIAKASENATIDVVEFRGDYFEGLGDKSRLKHCLEKLRETLSKQILLFTIRSESEGGEPLAFQSPTLAEINEFVITNRLADLVDVELYSGEASVKHLVSCAKANGVYIIMSNHDFQATPAEEDMIERLCRMQELGADIAKIAVMPQSKKDVLTLLSATEHMNREFAKVPIVAISMGGLGAISRVSGEIFGSAMAFATLQHASAPGQIPIEKLQVLLNEIHCFCI